MVSVEAWVRSPNDFSYACYILSKGAESTAFASYALYTGRDGDSPDGRGGLAFYVAPRSGELPGGSVRSPFVTQREIWDGKWHHVVGTFDGRIVRLYVDARLQGAGTDPGTPVPIASFIRYNLSSNNRFYIGMFRHTPSGPTPVNLGFWGNISDVRVWAELLLHVFDRFRQADSSITRKHGGLGLGLSIVRQLVEMHGGTVTAESPGTGEGTVFKVILPLMSVDHELHDVDKTWPMIVASTPTEREPSLTDLRVLVVDDERDTREVIAAVLTGSGAEVVSVGSAGEALAKMAGQQFDVLVSDIGMPEMDGYALISKVRQLPVERGRKIPAAALTAYAGIEDRRRALAAGYQMHIPKPVEPAKLSSVVASLAGRYAEPVVI